MAADPHTEAGKSLISKLNSSAEVISSHPDKRIQIVAHSSPYAQKSAKISIAIENLHVAYAELISRKIKHGKNTDAERLLSESDEVGKAIGQQIDNIQFIINKELKKGLKTYQQKRKFSK